MAAAFLLAFNKPADPGRLVISSINLDTPIIAVGLNDKKLQTVPDYGVSWFKFGYNMVLAGHSTGIFKNLSKLKIGDQITIDESTYVVTANTLYSVENFPTKKIYGPGSRETLYIITCAGKYNPVKADFSDRTVITASLLPLDPRITITF